MKGKKIEFDDFWNNVRFVWITVGHVDWTRVVGYVDWLRVKRRRETFFLLAN